MNSLKRAVIIKGNPKYLDDQKITPISDIFYDKLRMVLEDRGYETSFDKGNPHTSPDETANLWVGHSRGIDRLQYAPQSVKTIALKTLAENNGYDPKHYQLSANDMAMLKTASEPTQSSTDVILVKQRHHAKRAGMHIDWRVVVGDKAFSWATRKETPEPGKSLILHEQPVHDSHYALSEKVIIPDGQYGAGETNLEYAQKGKAEIESGKYVLNLNNGDRFLIKHMPQYGEKQWLLYNISGIGKQASMNNRYLEKLAVSLELYKHKQGKGNKWYVKGAKPDKGYEPTGIRAHKGKPGPKKGKLQLTLSKVKITTAHPHTNKKTMPKQTQKVKRTKL